MKTSVQTPWTIDLHPFHCLLSQSKTVFAQTFGYPGCYKLFTTVKYECTNSLVFVVWLATIREKKHLVQNLLLLMYFTKVQKPDLQKSGHNTTGFHSEKEKFLKDGLSQSKYWHQKTQVKRKWVQGLSSNTKKPFKVLWATSRIKREHILWPPKKNSILICFLI